MGKRKRRWASKCITSQKPIFGQEQYIYKEALWFEHCYVVLPSQCTGVSQVQQPFNPCLLFLSMATQVSGRKCAFQFRPPVKVPWSCTANLPRLDFHNISIQTFSLILRIYHFPQNYNLLRYSLPFYSPISRPCYDYPHVFLGLLNPNLAS